MNDNKISNMSEVKSLLYNKSLVEIELKGNPIEKESGYRKEINEILPYV
jgi:CO dehydrogenase nickel-insertion accessory protein CooC1